MSSNNNIDSRVYGPWYMITVRLSAHLPTHSNCQQWNVFIDAISPFKVYHKRHTEHNYGYQWLFVLEQDLNDWLCLSAAYHNINTIGSRKPLVDMQLINPSFNDQVFVTKTKYRQPKPFGW